MKPSCTLLAVVLAVLAVTVTAKRYGRCELAEELKNSHGFSRSELADWVCLVEHESSYNTAAHGVNSGRRPSNDYGLFQINDYYWCDTSPRGTNDCNIRCSILTDNDITDDVRCVRKIHRRHGFEAWYGWRNNCSGKDLSSYLRGCNV